MSDYQPLNYNMLPSSSSVTPVFYGSQTTSNNYTMYQTPMYNMSYGGGGEAEIYSPQPTKEYTQLLPSAESLLTNDDPYMHNPYEPSNNSDLLPNPDILNEIDWDSIFEFDELSSKNSVTSSSVENSQREDEIFFPTPKKLVPVARGNARVTRVVKTPAPTDVVKQRGRPRGSGKPPSNDPKKIQKTIYMRNYNEKIMANVKQLEKLATLQHQLLVERGILKAGLYAEIDSLVSWLNDPKCRRANSDLRIPKYF